MGKAVFVVGTGTDVGKTYVTGLILKKLCQTGKQAAYYKAAMSGNQRKADGSLIPGDALQVKTMSGISQPVEEMCPYVYERAVSPHLAARLEGNPVEMERVLEGLDRLCQTHEYVTVEGSGGILCPLRQDEKRIQLEDFIRMRNLSCILVADAGLGTINAVGLTAAYMKSRGIPLTGILFTRYQPDNPMHEDNRRVCEEMTGLKVVACIREGDQELEIPLETLESLYRETWEAEK